MGICNLQVARHVVQKCHAKKQEKKWEKTTQSSAHFICLSCRNAFLASKAAVFVHIIDHLLKAH